jgi:WD40 repeat protein
MHTFDAKSHKVAHRLKAHAKDHSCRAVRFGLAGDLLFAGSEDGSILAVDVQTGKASARKSSAHNTAISRLAVISETMTASGDDAGCIKLWDTRQPDPITELPEAHFSYVSDMYVHSPENTLISVSGDGTLTITDIRRMKIKTSSEKDADDELQCVTVIKGGTKVVCGTTTGVLSVWSWGYWNDCSDRFPGHPDSVTAVVPYDHDTVLTACGDGLIRVLSVQPNKMLGVLGEHGEIDIERLAMNKNKTYLASASHEETVRIWDLSVLEDDGDDDDDGNDEEDAGKNNDDRKTTNETSSSSSGNEDDSVREDTNNKRKRNEKGAHRINKKGQTGDSNNFFADLL